MNITTNHKDKHKPIGASAQKKIPKQYKGIYETLKEKPMYTNEISKMLQINLSELNSIITMMELEGYIEQIEGNQIKIIGG